MTLKKVSIILGIVISLSAILGIAFKTDERYAKANELKQIAMRLDQKIIQDQAFAIQQRIWSLEDRHGKMDNMRDEIKDLYRRLKAQLKRLEKRLERLGGHS